MADMTAEKLGQKITDAGLLDLAGVCYVVFGKTGGGEFSLADIEAGNGGFAILGEAAGLNTGYSVD